MTLRRTVLCLAVLGLVCVSALTLRAAPKRGGEPRGQETTVTGRLVDIQSFMTGKHPGGDPRKSSQEAIRAGVPSAIETEDGMIVIGMGERGPARLLSPLALQQVELKGRLYEKEGLTYLDLISAKAVKEEKEEHEGAEPGEEHPEEEHPEEEVPEEEP